MSERARRLGFTLIEVLVALAILGVIAVLAYRATAAMTDGETRLAAETERWRGLDAFFARLEADTRQAVPRNVRFGTRVEPAWNAQPDAAGNATLAFTRAGPERVADPGMAGQRIGYRVRDGRLEIVYLPQLDNVANAQPAFYALVGEVARFEVGYRTNDGAWSARWPVFGESEIPRALQVHLTLASGERIERWIVLR